MSTGQQRRVFIRDLEVAALLGIYDSEKAAPQRVIISVDLMVSEGAGAVDGDIDSVVSYETVVRTVEKIATAGHIALAETLAEKIAAACLADARVASVKVRIEKPDVFPNARSVGIEIERSTAQT